MPDPSTDSIISRLRELWDEPNQLQQMVRPKVTPIPMEGTGHAALIPDPPMWQPRPTTNDPNVGRYFQQLLKIAPQLQGTTPNVTTGPTSDVTDNLINNGTPLMQEWMKGDPNSAFMNSTLLGLTNRSSHNVSLNPNLHKLPADGEPSLLEVLAHELTHTSGYGRETEPREAEGLVRQLVNRHILKP